MVRTMLMDSKLTGIFWTHAVHTIVHIQNRVMLRKNNDKAPYELWKGRADNNLYIKKFAKDMHNEFEIVITWRIILLYGSSDMSKQPRNFYFSNQVYQRNVKEVWNGRLKTSYHSHENQLKVDKR
jgi:hypothetical protein